jgi:hypothetical protein
MTRIEVRGYGVMGWMKVLPGIPTPRLIQAGQGEAYFVEYPNGGGVWYLHERGYAAPDGRYTRVRIVAVEEPTP